MAKNEQLEVPGTPAVPSEGERARALTNAAVQAVLDAEANLRKARLAERRARAQEAALAAS